MARRRTKRRTAVVEQLMLEARRAGSVSTLHNRAGADRAGLGKTDWQCLDVLDWTGPIPAGELARRLGITSGAVTGVLDRLESAGFVRREADPNDRRRVIATLCDPEKLPRTPACDATNEVYAGLAEEIDEVNDRFDVEQLEVILAWLRATNDSLERSIARFRGRR